MLFFCNPLSNEMHLRGLPKLYSYFPFKTPLDFLLKISQMVPLPPPPTQFASLPLKLNGKPTVQPWKSS